jgi:hypothetical protein
LALGSISEDVPSQLFDSGRLTPVATPVTRVVSRFKRLVNAVSTPQVLALIRAGLSGIALCSCCTHFVPVDSMLVLRSRRMFSIDRGNSDRSRYKIACDSRDTSLCRRSGSWFGMPAPLTPAVRTTSDSVDL